ncbi:efflux RND transporter periplasmic adaptor subunit [Pseudomonas sp. MAFF 302030]|uniref:Efflux RND transporter periplasmic adaptor subunit n=1 Tax=Pseudomonas morbosilactucae TaxID=2938197 RepID=A0A9X1YYE6_9PSED|nr:HlyD family efflux transporter periplasmic adaptor subunit [Pseudomonas morbosilactucae]MCK9799352.1 efflux RND transporter periplasmic adaptor subunit [Pseudomonas morbosilactucae]MCK9812681.1 efflux RND transporter periplasmic adaptor subunit [Pseudomonas morbosilactucae]
MSAAQPLPANNVLAELLQLEQRLRAAASFEELGFILVNDSRLLLDYRQALLWRCDEQRLQALSGLALVERDAPFSTWLNGLCRQWQAADNAQSINAIDSRDLAAADAPLWAEHFPRLLLWLPIKGRDGQLLGALLLAREQALSNAQQQLLTLWLDAAGHAWQALLKPASGALGRPALNRRNLLIGLGLLLALLLVPIRQSVLAPAEIVALHPSVLRAPMQGVVERILVQPNQAVSAGQALVQLDARELQSRLEASRQALSISDAEFRQAQQQALSDERSKASLAVLQGRREQALSDVAYLQENLKRTLITAPRAGVAVFDDPSDWIGRPVSLGERIMSVAEPQQAQLEIQLPVGDAIELAPGAQTLLFLNTDPSAPLPATLQRLSYRASPSADGSMAYRLKAEFDETDPRIRVGLKGTAKVYAGRASLIYYLLRRPLATARIWLAL